MLTRKLKLSPTKSILLCFFAALWTTQPAHAENTGRIVKWKDEKGATHYGDKIPPQYADRENSVINRQGLTVKRNKPISHEQQAVDQAKLEQDKKDKALLGAFTSAEEIDLARERNIQMDLAALETLHQERNIQLKELNKNKGLADSYNKRKKPVPSDLNADIIAGSAKVTTIDQRINERNLQIESTRKRFNEDKKRYMTLKSQIADDPTKPGAAATTGNVPPAAADRPKR